MSYFVVIAHNFQLHIFILQHLLQVMTYAKVNYKRLIIHTFI